jgi:hypothetical protein
LFMASWIVMVFPCSFCPVYLLYEEAVLILIPILAQ